MKSKNKANIKSRLDLVLIVVLIFFFILLARIFYLTIIKGDEMRKTADSRRVRKVYETASRGEIRDVHGRLLAGNIPSFTVQILKDKILNEIDYEKRNQNLLKLIRFLEEDGAFYQGEFPMDLNTYIYHDPDTYIETSESPTDYLIRQLVENEEMLREFINGRMDLDRFEGHYKFSVKERAINAVRGKYIDIPVEIVDNEFIASEALLQKFLKEKGMDETLSADDLIVNIIISDTNLVRKILNHPIARAILFNIAAKHEKLGSIRMLPISIKAEVEGFQNRVKFVNGYDNLDINSSAKDIYLYLARTKALRGIIKKTYKDATVIPGEMLLKYTMDKGKNDNIEIYISEDKKSVFYRFINETTADPIDTMIESLTPEELNEFLLRDEIRPIVQSELLSLGINPRISVLNDIEFAYKIESKNLYERFYKKSELQDEIPSVEELFNKARDVYKIDSEISNYEAKAILNIYELIYRQGESAYKPIVLSYGIKNSTVAKIEESLDDIGVMISVEPIRYYPQGSTLAHTLGYMGKISSENEIKKYVKEKGYDKNEFIGKTGVEEYFEEYLHGVNGELMVEVDNIGNTINVLDVSSPEPGNTIYLTIDSKLQKMAEEYLKQTLELTRTQGVWKSKWGDYQMDGTLDKTRPFIHANAGAVVVMNAKTGEVLASASYPSYDPNLFSTGISDTDWKALHPENEKDPLAARPLLNIATGTAVQPGSVFKMITGFAGLQNGLNAFEKIYDGGFVEIGDTKFNCLAWTLSRASHGDVDLAHAIEHSCNYYFYSLALGVNQRLNNKPLSARIDIDDIRDAGKQFGLNEPSGIEINIPREAIGEVPEPEKKIVTIKFYIRQFLNENIRDFLEEEKSEDMIKEDIKEIAGWAEEGRSLTKNEIIKRLEIMGYIADKPVKNQKISLADRLKYDYINQAQWSLADTINVTIGQGASSLTTMQMARYVSALVNGGIKNKATLLNSIKTNDGLKDVYRPEHVGEKIDIKDPIGYRELMHGMELVSRSGTSRRVFKDFPVKTGSKTGTAQREGINPTTGLPYDDFAWFVSYAPADEPEVVVASVLFQGGTGSNAGPMARDLMAETLGLNRKEIKDNMPFKNRLVE